MNIAQAQFDSLNEKEKEECRWWGFFDEDSQRWHVDFDVSKFINHSDEGTVTKDKTCDGTYLITTRDVKKGEELTQNYLEFETEADLKKRGIK